MATAKDYRKFIKCDLWFDMESVQTDQQKHAPHPAIQKPYPEDAQLIDLIAPQELSVGSLPLREIIAQRESRRKYSDAALSLEELSYLLWATQGVRKVRKQVALSRTVPSAGARHPFETYLVINRVAGLEAGLYRYLSVEHKLYCLASDPTLAERAAAACLGQKFVARSAVTFFWTATPYRTEWRYGVMAPKLINLDAGHVCQNLYLAAESIGAGVCAIAAYHQQLANALVGVDGEDEFVAYVAPVGKIAPA